jgi:hypothetical protein
MEDTGNLMEYLTDSVKREEFEQFMKERYALENVRFLEDIIAWRTYFNEKNEQWRKSKAKLLIQTYIKERSLMEINISSQSKSDILRHFSESNKPIPYNLFEDAFNDIFQQTLFQHFYYFVGKQNTKQLVSRIS